MTNKTDLVVPVYLNQRIVFDLVAMLQGGIASVTQVAEIHKNVVGANVEATGSFGLSNVLASLIKFDFTGKGSSKAESESSTTKNENRIHTPASIFYNLRKILIDKSAILFDEQSKHYQPGDIIEFSATLQRNPFLEALQLFSGFFELHNEFSGASQNTHQNKQQNKLAKHNQQPGPNAQLKQITAFVKAMKSEKFSDLISSKLQSGHTCIITLENSFLNDISMLDLVDGHFCVLGKVTRVIGDTDSIKLNRNTVMGSFPDPLLEQFRSIFESDDLKQFHFPRLEWEMKGPVLQILPISIYA